MVSPQRQSVAGFDLPSWPAQEQLQRLLATTLQQRGGESINPVSHNYWNAQFFGLDRVKIFQDSSPTEQAAILHIANFSAIAESYWIEKAGMGYMAKMVLLAETTEERMLYSLFAADEATHFAQIKQCWPAADLDKLNCSDPFLHFLADLVETADQQVILFVIQVVLEGWGLHHYRSLANNAQEPAIANMFQKFLQDESRHHGSGVLLFNQLALTKDSYQSIVEALAKFLGMVQVGPQGMVGAIDRVKGHLSRAQKIQILTEIDTETHSGSRLQILQSLMQQSPSAASMIQALVEQNAFEPLPPARCL
jgi:tRNA isopentenyl-2-thiomethyl-A-37 hydroxylase MiaE